MATTNKLIIKSASRGKYIAERDGLLPQVYDTWQELVINELVVDTEILNELTLFKTAEILITTEINPPKQG